jgi:hypothetical protein
MKSICMLTLVPKYVQSNNEFFLIEDFSFATGVHDTGGVVYSGAWGELIQ